MKRGPLTVVLLLALLAGAGTLLLLRGAGDEPAPAARAPSAEAPPEAPLLPDVSGPANPLTAPPTAAAAPIETAGAATAAIGRAVDRTGRGLVGAQISTYSRDD